MTVNTIIAWSHSAGRIRNKTGERENNTNTDSYYMLSRLKTIINRKINEKLQFWWRHLVRHYKQIGDFTLDLLNKSSIEISNVRCLPTCVSKAQVIYGVVLF